MWIGRRAQSARSDPVPLSVDPEAPLPVKILVSKFGLLAAGGGLLTALAVVFFVLSQPRWGGALLALALIVLFVLVLLSHGQALRIATRSREVQQRDTRALYNGIERTAKDVAQTKSKVTSLAGSFESTGLKDVAAAGRKALVDDAKAGLRRDLVKQSTGNTVGGGGAYFGIGAEFEYGERAGKAPGHFETFALRAKSIRMRDAFARSATNLQFDYADMLRLVRALRAGKAPGSVPIVRKWSHKGLSATARVVANQRLSPSDSGDAVLLFRLVRDIFGSDKLGRSDAYIFAEALALEGNHREAEKIFRETKLARRDPMQAKLMDLNALQDRGLDDVDVRARWVELLNELYGAEDLAPVQFREELGATLFDSLTGEAEPRTVEGPLVSVLVPTFNGSDLIATTLDSLTVQTWKNIEIIVIDDRSGDEHREKLQAICDQYSDVTLLRQPRNLGAYMARNRALSVATGEFVTVHDDDDWSHPQKIERQVAHLLEHPDQAANMTRHARASEELLLARINNNPSFSQPNFSSLMARRELIDRLGGWDTVNRGADAEFRDRLVKVTGQPVEVVGSAPLSFTRTHGASLTAGEIGRGYIDPSRLFYQAAYFRSLNTAELVDGALEAEDFPRPLNMKPGMRGKHLGSFDLVFATDFRFPGGTTSLTANEIEFAAKAGLRVGMIQIDSPLNSPKDGIASRAVQVATLENVEVLSLNDRADVSLLVARHPTVLQFAENLSSALNVGHVVVIVNNPPILRGGTGVVFELETVRDNAAALFGTTVDIVPESEVTRRLTLTMVHPSLLADYDWPGFIDTERFSPTQNRARNDKPVLGRHSRDAALKWPDVRSTTLALYAGDDSLDVRILGGVGSQPADVQEELGARSQIIRFGEQSPEDFLRGLDFWAYFHSSSLTESFGMSSVEAMATGLVVFLPEYMRPNFGDGALYAEPEQVHPLLHELWSDPVRMQEQAARARHVVLERYSLAAFQQRVHGLLDRGRQTLAERAGTDG